MFTRNHKIKAPNVMGELSEIVNKFIISLQARIDKAVANKGENYIIEDVDELFHRYALALVFKCFYKQDKIIDFDAREDYWVNLIGNTLRHGIRLVFVLCTIFRPLKPFVSKCSLYLTEEGVLRLKVMSFIRQQTGLNLRAREELNEAKRLAEKEGRHFDIDNYRLRDGSKFSRNLIDHFIDKYHEGRLTEREYLRTSFFLFFAANKTSSDSISILIYHLASHPQVQEKLRKAIEIEGIECKYLLWCINESMRLIPPAPIGCSRIISRDYTTKEGYLIPANTWVYTSAYSIHREPEYWGSDANEFKPERWARARDFHPVQYLAFGAGKRNCIGKYFALHEMKLLMGALMGKFRFEECSKTINVDKFQCPMLLFTVFDKPLYVKISNLGS